MKNTTFVAVMLVACMLVPSIASANSVETYPAGVFSLGLGFGYTFANRRFTNSFGTDTERIVDDYNVLIRGEDFSEMFRGEIIGRTDVDLQSYGMELDLTFGLGIVDRLSFLLIFPIKHGYNHVDFELHDSTLKLIRDKNGKPIMLTRRSNENDKQLTAEDFKDVLVCEPDPAHPVCMFNYKPLKDFDHWGLGDLTMGFRYKVQDYGWLRHGLTVFAKFPTGYLNDPDDLFDSDLGKGHYDIGFWYGFDVYPIESLYFNVTGGYTAKLPYQREYRLYSISTDDNGRVIAQIPITAYWQKMKVNVDPGDNWDLYFGFNWEITDWLIFNNEQYFYWEYKDDFWAAEPIPQDPYAQPGDPPYQPDWFAVEYQTDYAGLQSMNTITFSTLKWVEKGKFFLPFTFSVFYSYLIAGKNVEQENIVGCSLTLFASFDALGIPWPFKSEQLKTSQPEVPQETPSITAEPQEKQEPTAEPPVQPPAPEQAPQESQAQPQPEQQPQPPPQPPQATPEEPQPPQQQPEPQPQQETPTAPPEQQPQRQSPAQDTSTQGSQSVQLPSAPTTSQQAPAQQQTTQTEQPSQQPTDEQNQNQQPPSETPEDNSQSGQESQPAGSQPPQ